MDPLTLAAEPYANSGHTLVFQNAEIVNRGNDRTTKKTIEACQIGANAIDRCVALPKAYQALRTQLSEQKSKRGLRQDRNPNTTESMGDTHPVVLQPRSDEGAVFTATNPAASRTVNAEHGVVFDANLLFLAAVIRPLSCSVHPVVNEADLKLQNAVAVTATGLPPAELHDTERTLGDSPLIAPSPHLENCDDLSSQDTPVASRPLRRTAVLAPKLAPLDMDIAALDEIRFSEQRRLKEGVSDCNFRWSGHHEKNRREAGVAHPMRWKKFATVIGACMLAMTAAPSQTQLPEDSGQSQDLLPSRLQYSANAIEMEVVELPSISGVDDPGLRSKPECRPDDNLVHLQFGVHLKAVAILHGGLQPAERLTGFGESTVNLVVDVCSARECAS
ncbi:hypothetical protein SprV_0100189300 [Sparganum proliferum]